MPPYSSVSRIRMVGRSQGKGRALTGLGSQVGMGGVTGGGVGALDEAGIGVRSGSRNPAP